MIIMITVCVSVTEDWSLPRHVSHAQDFPQPGALYHHLNLRHIWISHACNNKMKMFPMFQFNFDHFDKNCVIFRTHQPSSW